MRETLPRSLVVPAIILAEVGIPFSVLQAPTVGWIYRHTVLLNTVTILLSLVLLSFVLVESIEQASLLSGALAGLWAPIVGFWPGLIVERVVRNSVYMSYRHGLMPTGMLAVAPRLLLFAAAGIALGLVLSFVPWMLRRGRPELSCTRAYPRASGWPLAVTMIIALAPLAAALGVTRRVDWLLHQYATGVRWEPSALGLTTVEIIIRCAVLALAVAASVLFLMRKPSGRQMTVVLLVLGAVAAAFRWITLSRIPLPGDAGWRQLQSGLDFAEIAASLLAAAVGIPYFLRSRRLRELLGRAEPQSSSGKPRASGSEHQDSGE
jgi:hypothetical protein